MSSSTTTSASRPGRARSHTTSPAVSGGASSAHRVTGGSSSTATSPSRTTRRRPPIPAGSCVMAWAEPTIAVPPAPLGDVEVHDIASSELGMPLRIFVGHCGEAPGTTLVLTDGNGLIGLAVDTVRLMQIPGLLPSMLVVGVGYPDAAIVADTMDLRFRHLAPTPSRHHEGSGRADAFVRYFRTELFPWLDARFPGA